MEDKSPLMLILFLVSFSLLFSFAFSDSCSSKLSVSSLIPFNSSSMNCFSAWTSEGFILRYAKTRPSQWSFVLSAPDTGSYISIGFSRNGHMVGSSAIVGWISGSGRPGTVKQYYLGGTSSSSCSPDQGSLQLVTQNSLIISQSSTLHLAFQLSTSDLQPHAIYAVGPRNVVPLAGNYLAEHRNMASASVNFVSGVTSDAVGGSGFGAIKRHGLLSIIGWGVMIPIGIIMARYCKKWDPFWFYAHVSIQGVGFALGLAGIVMGFSLNDEGNGDIDTHKALGICILVFGCLQILAFLIRPGKDSKVRKYWNWHHYYVGRAAVALAIANIFFGLSLAHEENSWRIIYGVFLAVLVIVCIVLELMRCMTSE